MSEVAAFERAENTQARAVNIEEIRRKRDSGEIKTIVEQLADVDWSYLQKPFSEFTQQELDIAERESEDIKIAEIAAIKSAKTTGLFKRVPVEYTEAERAADEAKIREDVKIGTPFFLKNHNKVVWVPGIAVLLSVLIISILGPIASPLVLIIGVATMIFFIIYSNKTKNYLTIGQIRQALFFASNTEGTGVGSEGRKVNPDFISNSNEIASFLNSTDPAIFPIGDRFTGCNSIFKLDNVQDYSGQTVPMFQQGFYWYEIEHESEDNEGHRTTTYQKVTVPYFLSSIENYTSKKLTHIVVRPKNFFSGLGKGFSKLGTKLAAMTNNPSMREVNFSAAFDDKFSSSAYLPNDGTNDDELNVMTLFSTDVQEPILTMCPNWGFAISGGYFIALPPMGFKLFNPNLMDVEVVPPKNLMIHSGLARYAFIYHELIENLDPFNRVDSAAKTKIRNAVDKLCSEEGLVHEKKLQAAGSTSMWVVIIAVGIAIASFM
ncbi:MAG: hypothetical protein LBN03_02070 [Bifidobacteriaceae bacterium]|jgi:hypothetical protein|nr:hypothetical protein [Bifidobacteriaceae bacterium]